MFGRYEKLLDIVTSLSLEVANLKERVAKLELVDGLDRAEAKPDPVQERTAAGGERRWRRMRT